LGREIEAYIGKWRRGILGRGGLFPRPKKDEIEGGKRAAHMGSLGSSPRSYLYRQGKEPGRKFPSSGKEGKSPPSLITQKTVASEIGR